MRKSLESRIRKLEALSQSRVRSAIVFRYGGVRRLPKDTVGERHIALVTNTVTAIPNVEQCEFEERVGPAGADDGLGFNVYFSFDDDSDITGDPDRISGKDS